MTGAWIFTYIIDWPSTRGPLVSGSFVKMTRIASSTSRIVVRRADSPWIATASCLRAMG